MEAPDYSKFRAEAPATSDLATLSSLAEDLYLAELKQEHAAEALREAQSRVRDIAEHQIPELMDEIGILEFKTKSGIKLSIKDMLRASIPVARRPEAYEWLRERGHGDLIKRNVTAAFGRDEGDTAEALFAELVGKGLRVKDEEKVEPSTLKKFIKEQLAEGGEMPMDLFGATQFRQAKITAKPKSDFGD